MTAWTRPQREPPPLIWNHFCTEWLGLSRTTSDEWWTALAASSWSRAVALRSQVLCRAAFPGGRASLDHLVQDTMAPQVLMALLEDLITGRLLAPKTARSIEEHVLARTAKEGGWK